MKRLTTSGTGICYIRKTSESSFRCKYLGKNDKTVPVWDMTMDDIQKVLNRLSEYEDTGLSPAEVRDLVNENKAQKLLREYCQENHEVTIRMRDGQPAVPTYLVRKLHEPMDVFLDPGAIMPTRAHDTDAGLDLYSREDLEIPESGSAVFDTGVHIRIPANHYGKIESKSGLNIRLNVVSCGGVIDEGYTGSIKVKLYNLGPLGSIKVRSGDKIAQLIVQPCEYVQVKQVEEWNNDTPRGDKGFGSTGR